VLNQKALIACCAAAVLGLFQCSMSVACGASAAARRFCRVVQIVAQQH
jgi:hypothetical protein